VDEEGLRHLDLVVCSEASASQVPRSLIPQTYVLFESDSQRLIREILKYHWDLALPLAKNFIQFRQPVERRWMRSIALENALFAAAAALPDATPAFFSLLDARGFNSTTVLLTSNQMRLAFLMAAANDAEVGFREQTGQITAITAASVGWRSLARKLASRTAPSGSAVSKGVLAFIATYTTGLALERLHALGRHMTRDEKSAAYAEAYRVGRRVLDGILDRIISAGQSVA
jgi:hypothetical protein